MKDVDPRGFTRTVVVTDFTLQSQRNSNANISSDSWHGGVRSGFGDHPGLAYCTESIATTERGDG